MVTTATASGNSSAAIRVMTGNVLRQRFPEFYLCSGTLLALCSQVRALDEKGVQVPDTMFKLCPDRVLNLDKLDHFLRKSYRNHITTR